MHVCVQGWGHMRVTVHARLPLQGMLLGITKNPHLTRKRA